MKVKRIIVILTVVLALAFSVPAMSAPFPDVPSNHWAYDAVSELAAKGLLIGYPDGTFRGNNPLTRYEMAMIFSRLLSYLEKIAGGPSADISQFVTKGELADTLKDYVILDDLANYVTADQLADYVTFDALADYVTADQLADYVTADQLADYVTADQLADYVTADQLADYVTADQLADYVTADQLADYVTADQLADYVTVDQLADYVTVDQLADYVTADQLADYVTADQLADYVTADQLADYVTVDQLADYVTVDQLADYVTVDQLADYVTVDQLADYVTVDQLADYVTVDQLADYVTTDQMAEYVNEYVKKVSEEGAVADLSQFLTKDTLPEELADYVTVDQLADYVTFDVLADYVTIDQLADYVTVDQLVDYVTVDQLADYVTVDQLADYVTVDQLADYVTFDVLADYVTVDQLADYVTVDQLADYVTVDQLADYVTVDQLADYVTVDQLADYVTVDQLADYVTVDQLADYVTVDQLADYVTVDQLADYVTVDQLADYVTVDQLADYVTVDQLADYVTVDQLADYVTVDQLADYVTVDQLADYVTVDQLADYVTVDQLADYVTVDQLADYVTVDQLADYVTVDQLADYVTVDQLADYVTVDQLADYVTFDVLADYVTVDQLADYVTVDQLADYVTVDQLADYVTVDQLADYVTVDQLADYVTVDQLADYVTFDVLADYVTFDDLANYVTVDVLADYVTFDDLTNYVTTDDFDALMTLVADLSDQLEAMGVDVGDLKDRVGALEDAVANLKMATPENVAELSAKVADLEKKVDSNTAAVSALEKRLTYSITTDLTLTSNYKLGDTTQEPTYGTSTADFLSETALASLSDLPGVVSYLPVDVNTPATSNVANVTDLPGTGMTAAGNLTLTLDVSKKSETGNFSAYVDLTLGSDISDFYNGIPTYENLSVSKFKIYATDNKLSAEAGDLTAFKYTDLVLDDERLFLDVNSNPITQRGLTLTYNLSDNVSLTTSIVYLNNNNYDIIYNLVNGQFYSYVGAWYKINNYQDTMPGTAIIDVADIPVSSDMNTAGDYYYDLTSNQWYQVQTIQDSTPGTANIDIADTQDTTIQPVWANRLSVKFGDSSSFNLNLVKEKTNEIVGGTDLTFKVGNITVGGEYAVAMDRNFAALGGDAAAMKLNLSIPLGSILTVSAGYKDIGADYSATWGSYTADRTGYNAGATVNLGTFTLVGGYATEKSKSDSGATVDNTAYGVGLKTNILGTAVQYTKVSGTDPSELVELSLAPVSIFKLATKYDVGASTWDGLSAEIAIPNLPAVTAYYTPNGTFKYGVAILSDTTIADFLTLKAQIDSNPDTNKTQSFVDAKVKLTDNVSFIGAHYSYTNGQTAWAAGVNYSYNWSDNADLSVTLKHLEDPFDTPAEVFSASVSTSF